MSDRAIISVQLGHYANHVGAHFWNMQERVILIPPSRLQSAALGQSQGFVKSFLG